MLWILIKNHNAVSIPGYLIYLFLWLMVQYLQAKNERIEQLEIDLNESEKVILACFSFFFFFNNFFLTCIRTAT